MAHLFYLCVFDRHHLVEWVHSADNLVEIFAVTISDEIFEKLKKRNRKISIRGKVFDWVVTIPKEVATSLDDYTKKKFPQ